MLLYLGPKLLFRTFCFVTQLSIFTSFALVFYYKEMEKQVFFKKSVSKLPQIEHNVFYVSEIGKNIFCIFKRVGSLVEVMLALEVK